ncbi:MAG: hypothetical protein ACXWP0_01095 [Ktedonobacterales bacterium]
MSGDSAAVDTHVGFKSIEKINSAIHWFDEFLMSISTLLLGVALMLAIADVGTNGIIFQDKIMLVAWSVATGIGIESQLRTLVRRAKLAYKVDWWAFTMWVVLAVIIFAVSAIALIIFNTEKMLGLSENQALVLAHLDPIWYARGRAVLSVILVVISGFAYYQRGVARPNTEAEIAQLKHKQAVLPLQMQVDALEAQRRQQQDGHAVRRGVNVAKAVVNEVRSNGKVQSDMALMPANMERIVDADDPDDDDDPTPPRGGPRAPRQRGRRIERAQIMPPAQVEGLEIAQITNPLKLERVNAAKELLLGSRRPLKLREIAEHVDGVTGQPMKSTATQLGVRNIALNQLAAEGRLPEWAKDRGTSAA